MSNQFLWSAIKTFFHGALPLIVGLVLANVLAQAQYGLYVAYMLCATTIATIFAIPAGPTAIHYILKSEGDEDADGYYTVAIFLSLGNALLICLGMIVFKSAILSFFKLEPLSWYAYLGLLALAAVTVLTTFLSKMMAVRFFFKEQATILMLCVVVQGLFITFLAFREATPLVFALSFILFYSLGAFLYANRISREFALTRFSKNIHLVRPFVKFSALIYFGGIVGYLDEKIDMICINYFLDKSELAYYSYAITLGLALYGFGLAISQVTYPLFCQYFADDDMERCSDAYKQVVNHFFVFLSFVALVVLYHVTTIVTLLLPEAYLKLIPSLMIIMPGILLFATLAAVGTLSVAAGKPYYGLITTGLFCIVNAILNILLIPSLGIKGAAIATSASFSLRALALLYIDTRIIGIKYQVNKLIMGTLLFVGLVLVGHFLSYYLKIALIILYMIYLAYCLLDGDDRRLFLGRIREIYHHSGI